MIDSSGWLVLACILYLVGSLASFVLLRHRVAAVWAGHGIAFVAGGAALTAGIIGLTGPPSELIFFVSPIFGDIGIRIDRLAAFFVIVTAAVASAVAVYAPGYLLGFTRGRGASALSGLYGLFVASMLLVVSAGNAFGFLLAWEAMSLFSYFFVVYNHRKASNVAAGYLYLLMTHLGTAFIVVALLILGAAGGFGFSEMAAAAPKLSPLVKDIVFIFALIGFGVKAGIVPLHLWLPEAHSVAPSHVSALMSGVMIATAVYGLIRVLFDMLGAAHLWWGIALLAVGALSAVLGIMYALVESDLKRLLAFSSIENIGIVLMGLGAAAVFMPLEMTSAGAIALCAGLLHLANHALFKSLLFLGAGAVISSTGSRNIEQLGGLAKKIPAVAFLFFIGSAAIAAMPLLNGFVSEWLTLQSLLAGIGAPGFSAKLVFPMAAAAMALTGGFAAACFVKAYGITFLGRPRGQAAAEAQPVERSMIAGMAILAAGCAALGLFPSLGLGIVRGAAGSLAGLSGSDIPGADGILAAGAGSLSVVPLSGAASIHPLTTLAIISMVFIIVLFLAKLRSPGSGEREGGDVVAPWAGGLPSLTPKMQYSAVAFTKPLRILFSGVYRPEVESTVTCSTSEQPYFIEGIHYRAWLMPIYNNLLYQPVARLFAGLGRVASRLQSGSLHAYLAYIFAVLIVCMVVAR